MKNNDLFINVRNINLIIKEAIEIEKMWRQRNCDDDVPKCNSANLHAIGAYVVQECMDLPFDID